MIHYLEGDLLASDADALVNTVNTVGVMGKGLALGFKGAFPGNFLAYAAACRSRSVRVGSVFVWRNTSFVGPRWVINFPTKCHWRDPSRIEWVRDGLADLCRVVTERSIRSVAVPPLGCGLGGLDWGAVRPLIEAAASRCGGVDFFVYGPDR